MTNHENSFIEAEKLIFEFRSNSHLIFRLGELLVNSLKSGSKILTCGNGGSAADALHLTEELLGRYRSNRRSLPGFCLNADPTVLTCIGNDFGFDQIFTRQLEGLGLPGDCLIVFSTSGNSPNIISALQRAAELNITTIALTGATGGMACSLATESICVPSINTARIQEMHTFVMHLWMDQIEDAFSDNKIC
jgi:D-sedoheptulose 7-phosphate isomerase